MARKSADKGEAKRRRTDWDAVERDYRTGKFTLRELEDKHGAAYSTIGQKAKREGWTQDLSIAVRKATNAKLIADAVTQAAHDAAQGHTNAVLAAAEVNKQVILSHRQDLRSSREVALGLLEELRGSALLAKEQELLAQILAGSGADLKEENEARRLVAKAMALPTRVGSIKALAEALTKLQAAERKAFDLDDGATPDAPATPDPNLPPAEAYSRMIGAL